MERYEIHNQKDFNETISILRQYIVFYREKLGVFKPFVIDVKKIRGEKTPEQHRKYFALVQKLAKEIREASGEEYYDLNTEKLHYIIKLKAGFTTEIILPSGEVYIVPRSLADKNKEADIKIMNELIEFTYRFAAKEYDIHL